MVLCNDGFPEDLHTEISPHLFSCIFFIILILFIPKNYQQRNIQPVSQHKT